MQVAAEKTWAFAIISGWDGMKEASWHTGRCEITIFLLWSSWGKPEGKKKPSTQSNISTSGQTIRLLVVRLQVWTPAETSRGLLLSTLSCIGLIILKNVVLMALSSGSFHISSRSLELKNQKAVGLPPFKPSPSQVWTLFHFSYLFYSLVSPWHTAGEALGGFRSGARQRAPSPSVTWQIIIFLASDNLLLKQVHVVLRRFPPMPLKLSIRISWQLIEWSTTSVLLLCRSGDLLVSGQNSLLMRWRRRCSGIS